MSYDSRTNPIYLLIWLLLWPLSEVLGRPREVEKDLPWYKGSAIVAVVIAAFVLLYVFLIR